MFSKIHELLLLYYVNANDPVKSHEFKQSAFYNNLLLYSPFCLQIYKHDYILYLSSFKVHVGAIQGFGMRNFC